MPAPTLMLVILPFPGTDNGVNQVQSLFVRRVEYSPRAVGSASKKSSSTSQPAPQFGGAGSELPRIWF